MNGLIKNYNTASRGFTLIELIVAIGIGIIVMTMIMAIVLPGFRNMSAISRTKQLHDNAVFIINSLTYEIKQAKKIEVPDATTLKITITLPDSTTTTKIITKDANNNLTIDGVKLNSDDVKIMGLSFTVMPKSVQINFTIKSAKGDESFPVKTTIAQRNN